MAHDAPSRKHIQGRASQRLPAWFHDWPLEKRNVWFAGFNLGLIDLARLQEEGAQHG
jgi:hypothetical protein